MYHHHNRLPVILEVENNRTRILQADEFILSQLDKVARYPTETVQSIARGIDIPELGGWDGWVRMLRRPKTKPPWFPTGLLDLIIDTCRQYGYQGYIDDKRTRPDPGYPELGCDVIPLRDYQKEAVARGCEVGRGVFDMPPRCHDLRDILLNGEGACRFVEDLDSGDYLMGPDGRPKRILGVHTGMAALYRVTPRWGEPFTVTGNHVLVLEYHSRRRSPPNRIWERVEVEATVDEYLGWADHKKRKMYLKSVSVDFQDPGVGLPIAPYELGVLLGDGSLQGTPTITTTVPEILNSANRLAGQFGLKLTCNLAKGRAPSYRITNGRGARSNPLAQCLKELDLYDCGAAKKHIPDMYLRSTRENRLALLAGLLDTDGHLVRNSYFEFSTASSHMANDIAYLARSLGLQCTIREKEVGGRTYWRANILGEINLIPTCVRHKICTRSPKWRAPRRSSFTVEPVGRRPYRGFTVEGGRYLHHDFTILHNSGKTRTVIELHRQLALPTIWIAPTDRIVRQTVEVVESYFGENYVMHLVGSAEQEKAGRMHLVVCTAATAARLSPEFYATRRVLVVDEWHHCLSDATRVLTSTGWRAINSINVGDQVLGEGSRGVDWYPVNEVWQYPAPYMMQRTVLDNGARLDSTTAHKIYTPGGKVVYADELREGGAVQVLNVWAGVYPQGPAYATREGVSGAGHRLSSLFKLRRADPQGELRRPSRQLSWPQLAQRSRGAQARHDLTLEKHRLQAPFGRAHLRGAQPGQAPRCAREDLRIMARYGSRALRQSGPGGKGRGLYRVRTIGVRAVGAPGFRSRAQGVDGSAPGPGGGLVLVGPRSFGTEDSRGDRWEQSRQQKGRGRPEGRGFAEPGLGGISYSGRAHRGRAAVATTQVTGVEIIEAPGPSVYDIEVDDAHNYFAEGVKVSNSSAKTYRDIFNKCNHIYYRYGMTGTHFRSGTDDMEMHGLISNVLYKVDSSELLERGYLVPTRIAFVPVTGPKLRGVPSQFNIGHGKYGIHEHTLRNQLVTQATVTLQRNGRKVLVLVGTKAQGRRIKSMLDHWYQKASGAQFDPVEFVSTDRKRALQSDILTAYLESEEVQVLIGTSLLGEGVDLPVTDAIVYARGESAKVSLTQNAFRACTAFGAKRDAVIVDFWDQHHRKLKAHSESRYEVFDKEPIFQVQILDDIMALEQWLEGMTQ